MALSSQINTSVAPQRSGNPGTKRDENRRGERVLGDCGLMDTEAALTKMELPVSADCRPSPAWCLSSSEPGWRPWVALGSRDQRCQNRRWRRLDSALYSCRDLFGTAEALMAGVPPALRGGGAVLSRAAASELRAPGPPATTLNC